jgi:hypothetical protein
MTQSLITNFYKYNAAENFVQSFDETLGVNSHYYYVFASNHLPYSNNTIPSINDNVNDTIIDVYRNMVFGKKAQPTDVSLMIKRIDYEVGSVYDMYDDKDLTLNDKSFFVSVDEGGYYNVFKCLNNNNRAVSTVTPSLSSIGSDGIFYSSVDGYTWKYMYTVTNTVYDKFSTEKYIPFTANSYVTSNAVAGAIDSIKVIGVGAGYDNYIEQAYFSTSDVHLYSNTLFYGLGGATSAAAEDDFYKGCILTITSGTGAGQYKIINAYEGTANTKYVQLESAFSIDPDNSSTYSIYPGVYITGDGSETVNAIGWAYTNTASNTIYRVEILDRGAGYKIATAVVAASNSVGVTSISTIRPILPPSGGHGYNAANELYCKTAAISTKFVTTEGNTIPSTNQFRQIGVVLDPSFANVTINYSSSRGSFISGETAYSFYPKRVQNHVFINTGNNVANAQYSGLFSSTLNPGDLVYISDGFYDQVFTVSSVSNNSFVEFTDESQYDFSNASLYSINTQAYGEIIVSSAGSIAIQNLTGHIKDDSAIIGLTSGAFIDEGDITSLQISDVQKQFDTFVGAYKYTGTILSGSFLKNESVYQISANSEANGVLHSVQSLGGITNFFITNQNGIFNTSNTIFGSNSGASATLTDKYFPEIVFGSGKVLYLENLDPITRANTQTETFKLIFDF